MPHGKSLGPFARWLTADQLHAAGLRGHSSNTNHASARQHHSNFAQNSAPVLANPGACARGGDTRTPETNSAQQTHGHAHNRGVVQGARQVDTQKYVPPFQAYRDKEYECMDFKGKVILKQGSIRVPHFAHYHSNSGFACGYYENPGESQLHRDAKQKVAAML